MQPVPTRHRRDACIKMRTAQLHTGVVYTHPSPTIIFSLADQGTFSKTAGQSQAYYNTWNWERGIYDVNHLHILTCEIAVYYYICKRQILKHLRYNLPVTPCVSYPSKKKCIYGKRTETLVLDNVYLDVSTEFKATQAKIIKKISIFISKIRNTG